MISADIILFVVLLIPCSAVLVWLFIDAQWEEKESRKKQLDDRERVLEMLAGLNDYASLEDYKRAYNIEDTEIMKKRAELGKKH